ATAVAWPGEWSLAEIADHVLETHRAALDEFRCLVAGQRPPGPPVPAALRSKAPPLRPWAWLLREMKRTHADLLTLLESVPADFATEARAEVVMVINVAGEGGGPVTVEWVEELDWKAYAIVLRLHAIDHMNQAKKVLTALTGAPASTRRR
ncbi:MAG: DinB family protein, partial [Candidatus Rokuibacteriota bacterium]